MGLATQSVLPAGLLDDGTAMSFSGVIEGR